MKIFRFQEIQSLPLLSSTHNCQQTITSGHVERSECMERHEFRPFSHDDSAAVTTVKQSLVYEGKVNAEVKPTGNWVYLLPVYA